MVRRLVTSYVALVALALIAFTIPVAITLVQQLGEQQQARVERDARGLAALVGAPEVSVPAVRRLAAEIEAESGGRVSAVARDGAPIGGLPRPGGASALSALAGEEVVERGDRPELGEDGIAITVPARDDAGRVVGVVRVVESDAEREEQLASIWTLRGAIAAVVILLGGIVGVRLARRLTRPLRDLREVAARVGAGDFSARAGETGPPEVVQLATTLNDTTRRLDELLGLQRTFVADASHQLRTPLAAIRLWVDSAAETVEDLDTREDLDRATEEIDRMARLIDAMLLLARAEDSPTRAVPVDLDALVHERRPGWDERAQSTHARVVTELAPGLVVRGRAASLEQVLDNLVDNALGVGAGEVVVRARAEAGRVVVTVEDDGPGLRPADRERAFDRFWRGPGADERPGSGLGLAIVRRLVEQEGGEVTLEASATGGLLVRLTLPADRAATPAGVR
ncbi:HAMP domain-containing protein [Conexibacter sp. W3-3-2]|uniref:HAMP domain-containing sensor histidine kinase n=1 Tax=Conexibacter sp. W3-3-2 TaxID=2675227 RepID=UPI0012B71838|nr:HAMP domain-containing sensor histidine kinase [Conexibacter sp. W3-3-2]MTD45967.1 HAMP domain-containing protein [Conexibacter sp. W3-3-2]